VVYFWNVVSCSLADTDQRFRGAYCLHQRERDRDTPTYRFDLVLNVTFTQAGIFSVTDNLNFRIEYIMELARVHRIFKIINVNFIFAVNFWIVFPYFITNREDVGTFQSTKIGRSASNDIICMTKQNLSLLAWMMCWTVVIRQVLLNLSLSISFFLWFSAVQYSKVSGGISSQQLTC
jgi:hypothetical protein